MFAMAGKQALSVSPKAAPRSAGSALHWLTLQFSSPALEKTFQLSWARSILSVDRWYLLFTLLFMPVWLASEARRWSSSNLQERCPAAVMPYTGTGTDLCTLQQLVLYTACACMGARSSALLVLWLHPDWHVRNRTVVVAVNWLLDISLRIVLAVARCGVPAMPCGSMLFIDVCLALMFITYHLPFPVALPCCSLYWAGCTLLRKAVPPAVLLSEHGIQLLVQLLLPLGALHILGRRARLAYLAVLRSSGGTGYERTADAAAFAGALHPSTAESSRAAAVGQQPHQVQVPQLPDGNGMGVIPADSLVYESPLLHRTVAIKVQAAAAGPDSQPMLTRLAASMQSAVAGLPGMDQAELSSRVCVPGCLLFLGNVICAKQQAHSATAHQQQQQQPLLRGHAWQVALGGGCSSIGTYETVDSLESAAADGSLRFRVASLLDANRAAASCQEAYIVSSWGDSLQLAVHCIAPDGSSCYCTDTATSSGVLVRLVLTHGSTVVSDQEQLLLPRDAEVAVWTLQLQLPSRDGRGSSSSSGSGSGASVGSTHGDRSGRSSSQAHCGSPAEGEVRQPLDVMSLYILPAQAPRHQQHRLSSTGSMNGNGTEVQGLYAPLAHISLLMMPVEVASDLSSWLHSCKLDREQLQPLLVDLAVVLEAWSTLHTEAEAAAPAAAPAGRGKAGDGGLHLAAGAAGRLLQFFNSNVFPGSSEVAAAVQRQVLAVSRAGKATAA